MSGVKFDYGLYWTFENFADSFESWHRRAVECDLYKGSVARLVESWCSSRLQRRWCIAWTQERL